MRSRNLRPGFFRDEDMAGQPFEYRLLYQGLWCLADVEGRLEDRPLRIKADVFPYDNVDVAAGIDKLIGIGKVQRYEVDGRKLLWLPNLVKHTSFSTGEKEDGSDLPPPPGQRGGRRAVPRQPRVSPTHKKSRARDALGTSVLDTSPLSTSPPSTERLAATRILARLNQLRGTPDAGFRESPDLLARIRDGVPESDLLLVVEHQAPKLLTFEGGKFFRPATLFGTKNFQRYLDEAHAGPPQSSATNGVPEWKRRGYTSAEDLEHALHLDRQRREREAQEAGR